MAKKKAPPINRDVGMQLRGPRLSRLRAIQLIIYSIEKHPEQSAYVTVEFQGDVYLRQADAQSSSEYHEENKDYDLETRFTLVSDEVRNTLVAFCDCWIDKLLSPSAMFGFYVPNDIGKEKNTETTKALGITWPTSPIMELLSKKDFSDRCLIPCVRAIVLAEYKRQAEKHGKENDGARHTGGGALTNLSLLEKWADSDWTAFLRQIEWKFGGCDEQTLEQELVKDIQRSRHYRSTLAGKEGQIVSSLNNLIDRKHGIKDPTQRFIHASDVLLVFEQVGAGTIQLSDPAWKLWERLENPTDERRVAEKIEAVCPNVPSDALSRWNRAAALGIIEQQERPDDKSMLAMKYRIYDECDELLGRLRAKGSQSTLTVAELDALVSSLFDASKTRLQDCGKDYSYTLKNETALRNIIWGLIDSCYLHFDARNV